MAETNGEQLMNEMETFLNEAEPAQKEAETALPFETITDYLGDPNGFGDVTAKLLKKVTAIFDLAAKYNRHSSDYLKSCAQLEKGIKYLGGVCLQKYAMEQNKFSFPELGQLNTTNLYTMASIHFNKIDRALTEYMEQKQAVDDALLDMEYRFYHLMERIRATEVKIHNYDNKRYCDQEDYKPVVHGLAFSEKSWSKSQHEHDEPMAFQRARAFSVKSEIRNQKSGARVQGPAAGGNEEGRETNEEVSSELLTENEGMQREQFSKKDSKARIQDSLNEDGRVKNEEICFDPVTANEDSNQQTAVSCQEAVDISQQAAISEQQILQTSDASHPSSEEIPEFIRILERVTLRSRLHNLDYLGFTEEEMRQLTADPAFARFQPQMAAEMQRALEEFDSG
ncbi:MAG: hypothetical protein IJI41_02825 [Anaerolineaceae bacterium]|nr:hypothetical protein [Anaerolineaceae bacterium]